MAAKGTEPEKPVEIEDADAWNAVVSKGNKDLNVIDVYAEWCGPCMCLIRAPPPLSVPPPPCQTFGSGSVPNTAPTAPCDGAETYKKILFDNDALLNEAMEKEQKTVKYWSACAEKLGVESLEKFNGDPMPHLLIYLGGTLKQTIDGANAPKLVKLVNEHLESFVAE